MARRPGSASGQAAVEAAFANVELRAVEMAESIERSQRGNSSLFGLFALARQEQRLAGRKAIVYFSEGLQVPNQLQPLYRSVVSEANRANLSVYSVDARGLLHDLRLRPHEDRPRRSRARTCAGRCSRAGGRAVTREDVLAGEVAEDAITMNAQGMLGALSDSTGRPADRQQQRRATPASSAPSPTPPATTRSPTTRSWPRSTARSAGSASR